jgi:exodeoxyribonuclease-3
MNKGFRDFFESVNADIVCLQETKIQREQVDFSFDGYAQYFNSAVKKGYSGTAVFSRINPLNVTYGINSSEHDNEGRVITVEYDNFFLVNVYTPNAQRGLARLDYRLNWEDEFRAYVRKLDQEKAVIICGDMNVAHQEIDIKNPNSNRRNAGFSDEERGRMTTLLATGFIDTFRQLYPDKRDAYTWWSYMFDARSRNVGWRIDYFLVSERLKNHIREASILADVYGSDHCPVGLELF